MMTPMYFHNSIKGLEMFFGDITEEQCDALYEMFKKTDEYIFSKAIAHLRETYRYKHFPLPGDFTAALNEIKNQMRWDTKREEENCEYCSGQGIEIIEKYCNFYKEIRPVARPCSHCDRGKRLAVGWGEYDRKRQQRRA